MNKDDLNSYYYHNVGFNDTYYMGISTLKTPLDLWVYQEIIHDVRPDTIIECGTHLGGTTLFLAHMLDAIGQGQVISIDIENNKTPYHERIKYLIGSSTSEEIFNKVEDLVGDKILVILDSLHTKEHVYNELKMYSELVSLDSYIIVEDTNLNGHPVMPGWGDSAYEAVIKFLASNPNFIYDKAREHYGITFNPNGYLKRIGNG